MGQDGGGLAILHFDGFGILHFFLGPAFHAICFHTPPNMFAFSIVDGLPACQMIPGSG